jgi:hypothetical protein
MAKSQKVVDRRPDLSNVKGQPVRAQLRPPFSGPPAERRDVSSRRAIVRRVHGEFLEMPGLTLSVAQAARLFSLPSSVCARVFGELIEGHWLRVTIDGQYALLNNGRIGSN